nr:small integral membrane protein 22 [Loxodonta africana]
MAPSVEDLGQELEATAQDVLGKLKSRQLFQSDWDTAAFVVFLIFVGECGHRLQPPSSLCPGPRGPRDRSGHSFSSIGTVLFLLLLVIIHCCCCCCCNSPRSLKVSPMRVRRLAFLVPVHHRPHWGNEGGCRAGAGSPTIGAPPGSSVSLAAEPQGGR